MALPSDFPRDRVTPQRAFIIVSLVPSDATFEIELQRALENGSTGLPDAGTATTIVRLPPVPTTGTVFKDWLPEDNLKRFYRARHVRDGWTPGPWIAWTAGVVPAGNVGPTLSNQGVTEVNIMMNAVAAGGIGSDQLGKTSAQQLANIGRLDLILNGDFESGFVAWAKLAGADGAGTIETGSDRYKGARSLKLPINDAAGNDPTYACVDNLTDQDAGAELLMRVQPGERLLVMGAGKLSSASTGGSLDFILRRYDDDKVSIIGQGILNWQTETVWTEKQAVFTVPSDTFYLGLRVQTLFGSTAGTAWIDELHVFRMSQRHETFTEHDLGNKSANFTVDWNDGNNQVVRLTADVTVTLTNPLDGAVYVLRVRQDSTGGRDLTWPGSVHWNGGTTPTPDTGANKIAIYTLYHVGGVYYAQHTGDFA